jgi:hypothetical protein
MTKKCEELHPEGASTAMDGCLSGKLENQLLTCNAKPQVLPGVWFDFLSLIEPRPFV